MVSLKENIVSFCKTSAIRGLARAAREPFGFLRILWCFAVLIGSTVAAWYITKLLIRYYKYQTVTYLRNVNETSDFPDVTFCNLQPFHSRVPHETLRQMEYEHIQLVENMTYEKSFLVPWGGYELYGYYSSIRGLLQNAPRSNYESLLHQLDDIKVFCAWIGWRESVNLDYKHCISDDFVLVPHPDNGNCFTVSVNKSHNFSPQEVQALRLILYTDSFFNYSFTELAVSNGVEPMEGIAIHIHEHGSYFDVYNVLNFPPGISATVELDRQNRVLLPSPYGNCIEEPFIILSDGRNTGYKYSVESCYLFCLQEVFVKHCNCVISDLPFKGNFEGIPFCPNVSMQKEAGFTKKMVIDNIIYCVGEYTKAECSHCLEPCSSTHYFKTIHQAAWPHFAYQLKFYEKLVSKMKEPIKSYFKTYENITVLMENDQESGTKMLKDTDLIRKNFVEVTIRLQSHLVTELVETPDLTSEGILGTVGGLLNLWIGISFVTLFEVLDLLYRIVKPLFGSEIKETRVRDVTADRKW